MGRAPCCPKSRVKKGPWTPEEDEKLVAYIKKHGQGNWRTLPKNAGDEQSALTYTDGTHLINI